MRLCYNILSKRCEKESKQSGSVYQRVAVDVLRAA